MPSKTIFVVDDDHNILDLVYQVLRGANYQVIKADSGASALAMIGKFVPDMLILDVAIGDMNGGELYAQITEKLKIADIPVLFLTGLMSSQEEDNRLTIKVKNKSYKTLSKPFKLEELLKLVNQSLPA